MGPSNMWHFYVRKGKAYLPSVARTEAGFFLDIAPVTVLPVDDREGLVRAIATMIAAGNPVVATPARSAYSTPVVVEAAGVKTWSAFESGARCFTAYRTEADYEIPAMERAGDGWVENTQRIKKLPLSSSHEEVASALAELVTP
jgi:hypothetical protein